MHVSDVGRY